MYSGQEPGGGCSLPLRPVVAHVGDHLVLDALREAAVVVEDCEHLRLGIVDLYERVYGELPARYCLHKRVVEVMALIHILRRRRIVKYKTSVTITFVQKKQRV